LPIPAPIKDPIILPITGVTIVPIPAPIKEPVPIIPICYNVKFDFAVFILI